MAEVATSRPAPRGRGSAMRGGRGGARGGRGSGRPTNGFKEPSPVDDFAEQGEVGAMKKQYSSQLSMLKELFADWTDVDLLFALQETDGDLERTIEHISEGHVSKFSDVKTTKEKTKSKPKEAADGAPPSRSTRGRGGADASRAPRARGEGRGRGGIRGGRGAAHTGANGTRSAAGATSTATADASGWGDAPTAVDGTSNNWAEETAPKAAASEPVKTGTTTVKTWAQMFAKPPPAAPIPKKEPAPEPTPSADPGVTPSEISSGYEVVTHEDAEADEATRSSAVETAQDSSASQNAPDDTIIELTPSKDQLTKENVEHLPDVAQPAPTGTAASTVPSTRGPESVTPSVSGQALVQAPIGRPAIGGFQTTAMKATGAAVGARSASFNRRLVEQQEAVVMPGNHAVDRTAVQFGSLGLNGDDVDEDREELETRAQPPQHSPVVVPRASLPPVSRQAPSAAEQPAPEPVVATKPSTGLPPAPAAQQQYAQQPSGVLTNQVQAAAQGGQIYDQYSAYGQRQTAQKPYDPFGQQIPQQSGYDSYPTQSQAPAQPSQQAAGYSSAAAPDYSQYYTADQRNAYSQYYNSYGQQNSGAQQDAGASQQRTGSAFGTAGDSGYPSGQHHQVSQRNTSSESKLKEALSLPEEDSAEEVFELEKSLLLDPDILNEHILRTSQQNSRFGDNQSGHATPNPAASGQQQASQSATHQQSQGQGQHGGYPYANHPYYNSSYYNAYMNNYGGYGQPGYGGPQGFGKGGMYNQPHHGGYGTHDQYSSSPGSYAGFGGRDSAGLEGYGRSASMQHAQGAQSGNASFSGNDPFSRQQHSQGQAYSQGHSSQQASGDDALKPYGSTDKAGATQSPAIGHAGRPGSAANTGTQGTSGLPPPQSHQQGYGGFPGHQMGSTSQYGGGLGGLGGGHTAGAQHSQQGGYGSGYGGFGGGSYGSYGGRGGGWGNQYGGH